MHLSHISMGSYLANRGGPRLLLVLYQLRPIIEPGTQKTLRDNNNHHMGEAKEM